MNFVYEWVRERCPGNRDCENCTNICRPRFDLAEKAGCGEHIIWMLMFMNGCVIHHKIADRLANVCGATLEERDSIVSERRMGKWFNEIAQEKRKRPSPVNAKSVLAVDRLGNVIQRFNCMDDAMKLVKCSYGTLAGYCNGQAATDDEFKRWGFTFRYAADWDDMTPEERLRNIQDRKKEMYAGKT